MANPEESVDESTTSNGEPKARIKTICVLPIQKGRHHDAASEIRSLTDFLEGKTKEYEKVMEDSSAVLFTANVLQPRVVSWEFSAQIGKLYETFGVRTAAAYDEQLNKLSEGSDATEETKALVTRLCDAFGQWDAFLCKVDAELEKLVGPKSLSDLPTKGGSSKQSTLKTLIEESPFDITLISVVASFKTPHASQHALRIYESLPKFNQLGCDVLLLTKEDAGSGFLKIVGVPFRQLLGEQEALGRLLKCGQYARSLADSQALHKFTEMTLNDEGSALSESSGPLQDAIRSHAENATMVVNRTSEVLYSHNGDDSDWPNIDTLLMQVQKCAKPKGDSGKTDNKPNAEVKKESAQQKENPKAAANSEKKRCCTVL